nr:flagellar basal body protein [uncultured Gellertiella sp.]
MSLSAIMGIAVSGLQAQSTRVAAIANNVANSDTPGYRRLRTDMTAGNPGVSARVTADGDGDVDPTGEMTGMIEAGESFAANASVFDTGASLWDMLLSMKRD